MELHSFHVQIYKLNLLLVLIEKSGVELHRSRIRLKQGENVVFNSHELYYIAFMYKYYQLTLLLILIEKFDQSQTFSPDWAELGLIRAE